MRPRTWSVWDEARVTRGEGRGLTYGEVADEIGEE